MKELQRLETILRTSVPLPPSSDLVSLPASEWVCPRCGQHWPSQASGIAILSEPELFPVLEKGCLVCYTRDLVQPRMRLNRYRAHGFDAGHMANMRLITFKPETDLEKAALRAAQLTIGMWTRGEHWSIWFWSPLLNGKRPTTKNYTGCGNGKTHLAVALACAAIDLDKPTKFVRETDLLNDIKASYDDNKGDDIPSQAQILDELNDTWLLVIDDLGSERVKPESLGWYQGILYAVIDALHTKGRSLVFTTNLGPDALAERLGPRLISRLGDMGGGVQMDGRDRRIK